MPRLLLISSQSDYLIRVFDRNSHIYWQTVQIQISWKPTDLDLYCLLTKLVMFSKRRVKTRLGEAWSQKQPSVFGMVKDMSFLTLLQGLDIHHSKVKNNSNYNLKLCTWSGKSMVDGGGCSWVIQSSLESFKPVVVSDSQQGIPLSYGSWTERGLVVDILGVLSTSGSLLLFDYCHETTHINIAPLLIIFLFFGWNSKQADSISTRGETYAISNSEKDYRFLQKWPVQIISHFIFIFDV